ncbi:MAG: hypothetical protein ACTSRP_06895 [Candidatus Helarchaeota archaeon]
MSRGHGGRGSGKGRGSSKGKDRGNQKETDKYRSSRSSVKMTWERARAIQSHADKTGRNQDFKSRAMSAAYKNEGTN